ncbi:MAG: PaaI family thioesterase [Propionicimonas sp.]|uniref:PaaI family thioesterase n=1 Tax=Propionicimonas sp. TaxID=1955623 RepID=UPI002B1ECDB5|nr:PaaI family thioesterase [Propionicimonas sp.]MEA4944666.1 PaaI family thioesterase [Propionicimonas sp.]
MPAIQDCYPARFAHCHGCGPVNPDGLHLKSHVEGDQVVLRHTPAPAFTGGVPDHAYGGLLASLLDCHGAASATAFAYRARGGEVGDGGELPRFVSGTLTVVYRRPTPMGCELVLRGRLVGIEGRKVTVDLELSANDEVCVTGRLIALEIPAGY